MLTDTEFRLLTYLAERAGVCCSRSKMLDDIWGIDFDPGTNVIDFHISSIRKKLRAAGIHGLIATVRGRGFRFEATPDPTEPGS